MPVSNFTLLNQIGNVFVKNTCEKHAILAEKWRRCNVWPFIAKNGGFIFLWFWYRWIAKVFNFQKMWKKCFLYSFNFFLKLKNRKKWHFKKSFLHIFLYRCQLCTCMIARWTRLVILRRTIYNTIYKIKLWKTFSNDDLQKIQKRISRHYRNL